MKKNVRIFGVILMAAATLTSCSNMNNTGKGALIGTGGGALLGTIIGAIADGNKGAAIGAAIGAVAAGAYYFMKKNDSDRFDDDDFDDFDEFDEDEDYENGTETIFRQSRLPSLTASCSIQAKAH